MKATRGGFEASFGDVFPFLAIFGPFLAKYLLENPRFPWRRVGLRAIWGGNGPVLLTKSIGVGLDRVGCDQRRFGGEFWRFFVIFGHFRPFLAHFWPILVKVPAGEHQISVEESRFEVQLVR